VAVAPLTTAVLESVDRRHTGTASGLNSAVARTGGLIATALLGLVLARRGPALIAAFHDAALIGAAAALAAGLSAFLLLRARP
jgi:predicted MFS family arabinose efflux permease